MSFGVLDPRSGTVSGELPCGVQTADGAVQNTFVLREMTGVEEDLLAGKGAVMPRLNQVIVNCLDALGGVTDKRELSRLIEQISSADRMMLLINVRRASLGDLYEVNITCPECGHSGNYHIDLSGLETTPMDDPSQRTRETTLASGKTIKWHVMTGADENWLQSQAKRLKNKDLLTLAMLARIEAFQGEDLDRRAALTEAMKQLKALTLRERNEIREIFQKAEGGVDTSIEHECEACGHEFSGEMDVGQPGFFFPAAEAQNR